MMPIPEEFAHKREFANERIAGAVKRDRAIVGVFARLDLLLLCGVTLTLPFAELWFWISLWLMLHSLYPLLLLKRLPERDEAVLRTDLPVPSRAIFRSHKSHLLLTRSYVLFSIIHIPARMLNGLTGPEVRAQLAHEFSHCYRQDWFLLMSAMAAVSLHILMAILALVMVVVDTAFPSVREILSSQPGVEPIGPLGGVPVILTVVGWLYLLVISVGVIGFSIHRREFAADTLAAEINSDGIIGFLRTAARKERFITPENKNAASWNEMVHPTFADRLALQTTGGVYSLHKLFVIAGSAGAFFTVFAIPAILATTMSWTRFALCVAFAGFGLGLIASSFQLLRRKASDSYKTASLALAAGFWTGIAGSWGILLALLVLFADFILENWINQYLVLTVGLGTWLGLCVFSTHVRCLRDMSAVTNGFWWALLFPGVVVLCAHIYSIWFVGSPVESEILMYLALYLVGTTVAAFGADIGSKSLRTRLGD